ncbi:MAG: gliding motility-associated C-terminal domain-containing protein [bacterium]|nr:gliding motility-associated C-terminal domain-containing protein [bacterium]
MFKANATHNRAGEITYKRIDPFFGVVGGVTVPVYNYLIIVTKYTNDGSQIADRCVDTIYFGDGQRGIAARINGSACGSCLPIGTQTVGCGVLLNTGDPNYRVKLNTYTLTHTYPGAGTYIIRTLDPNRNADVENIPNSVNLPFYIESQLVIDNFTGANTSPVFSFPPIDKACLGICFEHNPGAYDPDGDSLSFEITTSRGANGQTVQGYFYPASPPDFGINSRTGLVTWCSPAKTAEYNIAFIVREWRKNTSGTYKQIGYVLRDMQVIVNPCPNAHPPQIAAMAAICVEAGKQVNQTLTISDQDNGSVTVAGGGGAFSCISPIATVSPTIGVTSTANGFTFNSFFKWQTTCDHIRSQEYLTTFKAQDNGSPVKLVTFQSLSIKVVPPSVKNVTATPLGSAIKVTWSPSTCNPTSNKLLAYKIYRKEGCVLYVAPPCVTGLPAGSGFELLGQTTSSQYSFIDDNKGDGLIVGKNYSYVVVAEYEDGIQTFGSSQVCAELKRDVPILLNADVLSTSSSSGSVQIKWALPLTTAGNLDLTKFKGPYRFELKHRTSSASSYSIVFSTTKTIFADLDTQYVQTTLNTVDKGHEYIIDFYSDTTFIGSSQRATCIFLITTPSDRRVDLQWASRTPWNNYKYTVLRKSPGTNTFVAIGTTSATVFSDRQNVLNGESYCYFIRSAGAYSDSTIFHPLINNSQESCATAKDLTPPVTPTLTMDANCPSGLIELSWTDISPLSDDVDYYLIFFKPTVNEPYVQKDKIKGSLSLIISPTPEGLRPIPGCYAIKAVDINNNIGELGPDFCVDNCPEFELPNIFSPNGDSINDHFKAVKVFQIKLIDLTVTDRWGNLVYKTDDPYFKWNGISQITKQPVSEGTFFYVCDVYEPRLKGTVKRTLHGYVQVVR